MSTGNKQPGISPGDYVSREEALLDKEGDIERRIRVVNKLVSKRTFSLQEALEAYEVTVLQYWAYMVLKNEPGMLLYADKNFVITFISSVASTVNNPSISLDLQTQHVLSEMRNLSITG